ncbi:uncharacterized protein LOC115877888 [Sitophilus oryzae]|uniref:Uncharacterized protein LOC115877888 n=1 Tax=Sitophilus oryzae TaxID=7048 RepID=A0A6J2XHA8_SITOR|nr:uncharacterized protein LOC115877888 [Sitophilus oryzae]
MVIKTATYSGMNLKGEIRESISLDEDDLSDVEDEVFIRDGKNGYKLAEELNVKRPLMAPRRKIGKHDCSGSRLKAKHTCRAWCKPCCYVLASLSVLIGLIVLVVVLVSIYPLPLDRLRDWIISKPKSTEIRDKPLPCTNLKVSEVWSTNLPILTSDSPVRVLDIDGDKVDDVIFGFGTGENYNILPPEIFCPVFLGVSPPCRGGIISLNGASGDIIWRHWINDTVFSLHCTADINQDNLNDCLATGVDGTVTVIDSKTGQSIWEINAGRMDIFLMNFIPDQDGDNVSDIISSHSSLTGDENGHIILLSGKTGRELKRLSVPNGSKTFYMPQIFKQNSTTTMVLYGTGSPNTPGKLRVISLDSIDFLPNKSTTVYEDKYKGILTQAVLVDISGDGVPDIISSMYNSTVVAIDGKTLVQIWNYSIPDAVTSMIPTPAYFNSDNVTDFLVVYQKYDNIFHYNYTQTLIIDGFTGQPVYQPLSGGLITQGSGLTMSMEGKGHDIFLFWTRECSNMDIQSVSDRVKKSFDQCSKQFNSTTVVKLNALNEYHQPPGIILYNSGSKIAYEYKTKSTTMKVKDYYKTHELPKVNYATRLVEEKGQSEIPKSYSGDPVPIGIRKYGKSSFRHKDRPSGIVKEFNIPAQNGEGGSLSINEPQLSITDQDTRLPDQSQVDYNIWMSGPDDLDSDFSNYNLGDDTIPYNQKQMLFDEVESKMAQANRDPRSKEKKLNIAKMGTMEPSKLPKSTKKNLSDKIYGYRNVRLAKDRLLNDQENLPTDILRDTYFKNEENRLKKAKFEQRDVNSHLVGQVDSIDVKKILEDEKENGILNGSTTLWDLENEKELNEQDESGFLRDKRQISIPSNIWETQPKVSSVGAILASANFSNTIDVVFIKYWQPVQSSLESLLRTDIEECMAAKFLQVSPDEKTTASEQNALFQKECQDEQDALRSNFVYFNQLVQLKLGQMTVYRMRITCNCDSSYDRDIKARCVRFLPKGSQGWSEYLGQAGDGIFVNRP